MLGFDPTITRLLEVDGREQYDILLPCKNGAVQVFRTLDVLYDGSDQILGRGTRVWKAQRVVSDELVGEPVALKDSWVDDYREREGSIDARIRQAAFSLKKEDRDRLERCLLTVIGYGDVTIGDHPDRTLPVPADRLVRKTSCSTLHRETSCIPVAPSTLLTHHRIAYREIGKPLRTETSLGDVFKAIVDVCGGMFSQVLVARQSDRLQDYTLCTSVVGPTEISARTTY